VVIFCIKANFKSLDIWFSKRNRKYMATSIISDLVWGVRVGGGWDWSCTHCVILAYMFSYATRPVYHIYIYRIYTNEWCGVPLFTIETAPFFCVYPVYIQAYLCTGLNNPFIWSSVMDKKSSLANGNILTCICCCSVHV
jgi:hypothetical protein